MNQEIATSTLDPTLRHAYLEPEPRQGPRLQLSRSLRMHRKSAVAVAALVALFLVAAGLMQTPLYQAQSVIYIQPATPKPLTDLAPGLYDSSRYDSYMQQQLQTIDREDILADALHELPAGMWQHPGESEQSAVARLKAALKVERVLSSYEVTISLKGDNANTVTQVVNAVTSAFLKKGRSDELAQSEEQLRSLTSERQNILNALSQDRQEQAQLSSTLGVADTASETTGNPYDVQLQDLRSQVAAARQGHDVALAQLTAAARGTSSSSLLDAAADDVASTDPSLASLKVSIIQRRSALTTQMAGMTTANPLYKQDQEELARLDDSLAKLSERLRSKASQQLEAKWKLEAERTGAIEARLESQLAEQTSIATHATPRLQRASDLVADIARLQARYTETDNAIHSLELQQSANSLVHLSLPASQPQQPQSRKRSIILLLALPLALLCGVTTAMILQKADQRIYIAEDVDSVLRFPPMAVLPHPEDVDGSTNDAYLLRLAGGIAQAHRVGKARTFVFTGATPGMATSSIVEALAKRMNEIGYKVIVTKASAALSGAKRESQRTGSDGGQVIAAGAQTQLMPVKEQRLLVDSFREDRLNGDMLFIDALPLLCSAEAEFDTRLVDVTVLLAESGSTTRRDLSKTVALIQRLTSAGIAAVVTDLRLRNADPDFLTALQARPSAT